MLKFKQIDGLTAELNSVSETATQANHGLSVGNAVRLNGSGNYVKAQADTVTNAEVIGVVSVVTSANNFRVALPGTTLNTLSGLTAGNVGFLSATTAGLVVDADSPSGTVSKPVWVAISAVKVLVLNSRGVYKVAGTAPATDIYNEPVGVGTVDGSLAVFTLAQTPAANSLRLVLNGLLRREGVDYTRSGVAVTFGVAPPANSLILASYEIA